MYAVRFQHGLLSRGGRRRSSPPGSARVEGISFRGISVAEESECFVGKSYNWTPKAACRRFFIGPSVHVLSGAARRRPRDESRQAGWPWWAVAGGAASDRSSYPGAVISE